MPTARLIQSLVEEDASAMGQRNPFFHVHQGTARDTTMVAGKELINFSSYNYLGLSGDERVIKDVKEAVERYGTSVSATMDGSRSSQCLPRTSMGPSSFQRTSAPTALASSPMVMVGRNRRAKEDVEVGATNTVERIRSSDCTMTAYRLPRCSCPRVAFGARSRWTSPRTELVHGSQDPATLGSILWVARQLTGLSAHLFPAPQPDGINERLTDRFRRRRTIGGEFGQRAFGSFVGSEVQDRH